MNQDQVMSIARSVLTIIGTILLTYSAQIGITTEMWSTISGGVLMLIPVVWGVVTHSKANTVAAAAKIPEVAAVVVANTPAGLALKKDAGSTPEAQVRVAGK